MRLKLIVAYDGRPFLGWQSQKGGDTIQDKLEAAFEAVRSVKTPVHGAGRTDAGVHALAQCAHADVEEDRLELWEWLNALNANLPREIRVMRCTRAAPSFHARFSAKGKVYTYRLWSGTVMPPLEMGRAWQVAGLVDLAVLEHCASMLKGTHDFAGFSANRGHPPSDTVRELSKIAVRKRGSLLTLEFRGTGFLYKMVRLLTGTMIRCAQGKLDSAVLSEILRNPARKTSFAAPADGLYLTRVLY